MFCPVFCVYDKPDADLGLHISELLQVKERPDNILEDRKHVLHQMWERNQE